MPGDIDNQYVMARRVLLDALEALGVQLDAVILVGAQAVYIHTGETSLAVAPYTTDADLALDPQLLQSDPALQEAMQQAGFALINPRDQTGIWRSESVGFTVDLLVPAKVSGRGDTTRGGRIEGHSDRATRTARGLEGALVDKQRRQIAAFESDDDRRFEIPVAGPAALLVAKLHKIRERLEKTRPLDNKDALDIYRLLQVVSTEEFVEGFAALSSDERSQVVAQQAANFLAELFSEKEAIGSRMAAEAASPLMDYDEVSQSCSFLTGDLLSRLREAMPELFRT